PKAIAPSEVPPDQSPEEALAASDKNLKKAFYQSYAKGLHIDKLWRRAKGCTPPRPRVTSTGRPILTQLSGLRAMASLWLVLGHYMQEPRVPGGALCFIVLSGYVTHYAYHGKGYATRTQVFRFYARRFGAILVTYYASWLTMLLFAVLGMSL
ncbi:hypothetical protein T492DRAFT_863051, partial [Pavlovales sp. CCMP2436]